MSRIHRGPILSLGIVVTLLAAFAGSTSAAPSAPAVAKVAICHLDSTTGKFKLISVSDTGDAVATHLGHGDGRPGVGALNNNCGPKAAQSITFGPLSSVNLGNSFAVSATASSGLPVSFASLNPYCVPTGPTVFLATVVGTCAIQATQAGNASYLPAAPVTQTVAVFPTATLVAEDVLVGAFWGRVTGAGLDPAASVVFCYTSSATSSVGGCFVSFNNRIDSSGNLLLDGVLGCQGSSVPYTGVYYRTLRANGTTITSNVVDQTTCPG